MSTEEAEAFLAKSMREVLVLMSYGLTYTEAQAMSVRERAAFLAAVAQRRREGQDDRRR